MHDDDLRDPDSESVSQFKWDEEFQRTIISLLVFDRSFLLQAMDLIHPDYFTNRAHQETCRIVFEHFKKYRYTPTRIELMQELKNKFKDNKSSLYYLSEVDTLFDSFEPNLDSREYLTDKITYFAKIQALQKAFARSLKEIDSAPESEDTWVKVYEWVRSAMNTDRNFDVGLEYFKTIKERYDAMGEETGATEYFTTGYESFDEQVKGGGYIRGEMLGIVAGSGVGKCHAYGTKIRMHDGTVKQVQDIVVGDLIMGDDSTPRKVLNLVRGRDQMYEVKPVKGDSYVVNSEHIISLKLNRSKNIRYHNSKWRCEDGVFDIPIKEYQKLSNRMKNSLKGYRVCVEYPSKNVLVDPYILGVWLGDGSTEKPEVKFSEQLKTIGVYQDKHIPTDYLINDRNVRLQILAGLIDTDGHKVNNCYEFVNKNQRLAEEFLTLARSLGFAAYYGKNKIINEVVYKRIFVSGNLSQVPVKIGYKKCNQRKQIKDHLVTGITVTPVGEDNYYGFETDGNHRYLLEDFTVTHNSVCMACIAAHNLRRKKNVLYISLELTQERVAERFDSILTGLPIHCLYDIRNDVNDKLEEIVANREDKNIMLIKQFPSASADVNTIRAYMGQLKFYGFRPDVVVIDYVGEMKDYPGIPTHESRERLVKELRGLASEERVFMITAFQPNRGSKDLQENNGVIEEEHLADSFGQIRPLDGCLSLNQNKNEKAINIGRMWVIKQRNGRSRYMVYVRFDTETLRIYEISHETYKDLSSRKKDHISESVEHDIIDKVMKESAAAKAAEKAKQLIHKDEVENDEQGNL